jgi:hypothetical protein
MRLAGHRDIDGVIDIALDDQEAGHTGGDRIVRGAVSMWVVPEGARRIVLRRTACAR